MKRRYSKEIHIGNIKVGGDAPITVQSMLNTKTIDIDGSLAQIKELTDVGCDLIRLAVPDEQSAQAFKVIAEKSISAKTWSVTQFVVYTFRATNESRLGK